MSLTPREKAVIMYREGSRADRLRLAKGLGFTGKPASKLRSLRRILKTELTQTQKFNVTSYFKPYVTQENFESFWEGQTPPFTLQGSFTIRAYGIGIFLDQSSQEWETRELYQPTGERRNYASNNIRELFQLFQEGINRLFENPERAYETFGISFNQAGFNPLLEQAENELGQEFAVPGGITQPIGIDIVPSTARIVNKKPVPYTPARQFPKKDRAKREAYINRSWGQLTKEGGRLSEFKTLD